MNKTITIEAKRWFQKTYGNTYHSVRVWVDHEEIAYTPFEYGYGECYLQTAHKILQEANIYPTTGERLGSGANKDYYEFQMDMRYNRDKFVVICNDVNRKKDL